MKVDTMKLNDEDETNHNSIVVPEDEIDAPATTEEEDVVPNKVEKLKKSKTLRSSRAALISMEQSHVTQGDKLNQIKAMRRRPSRSVNVISNG